jgi:arylsulfatase A-like enzyme
MSPELVTLAEAFGAAGYRTAAMVGNPMVGRGLGFDQGFEVFRETWREEDAGDARRHPAVTGLAEVLDARDERPLFAFVNLIEPHSPYDEGPYLRDFDRHPSKGRASNRWRAFFTGATSFTREDFEHLVDRYDGEVRYADEVAGALVDLVRERGLFEETLLVVTSDHGENFGEHGLVDHCFNLYEETTRVPLLIRYPRAFPARLRDDPVQLVDLAPTLLAVAGVPPIEGMQGLDLSRGQAPADRAVLLSYGYPKQALTAFKGATGLEALQPYLRRLWAVRAGDWKLIVGSAGKRELYHLAADPRELVNLAEVEVERADELDRLRERLLASVTRGEPRAMDTAEIDAETWREMQELGYAGER